MITHPEFVLKYCPRCGCNDFKTKDKGHSFYCEECHLSYYINSSAAVACLIFNEQGKLLLTRRAFEPAKGKLDLPGGFVEPMESAEDAIAREIREELGVKVQNTSFLVSFPNEYVFSGLSVFTLDLAYVCTVDNLGMIVPADDVSDIEFMHLSEIKDEELCSESMAKIIRYYINTIK